MVLSSYRETWSSSRNWELSGQLETVLEEWKRRMLLTCCIHLNIAWWLGSRSRCLATWSSFRSIQTWTMQKHRKPSCERDVVFRCDDVLQDCWSKAAEPYFGSYLGISLLQSKFVATDNFLCLLQLKRKTQFQLLEFYSLNSRIVISF